MIPIFRKMAKLVQGPTRFTHPEWTTSNLTHYANAESERAAAERLVEESKRLSEETAKRTEKTQRDVSKKLGKFQYSLMLYICHHMVEFFHVLIILRFTSIQSFITCLLYFSKHMSYYDICLHKLNKYKKIDLLHKSYMTRLVQSFDAMHNFQVSLMHAKLNLYLLFETKLGEF